MRSSCGRRCSTQSRSCFPPAVDPRREREPSPSPPGGRMPRRDRTPRPITILLADDDEDDRELTRDALQDSRLADDMRFVVDGQDLIDYLRREGRYSALASDTPRPGIILLDLNMPRK